MNNLSGQQIKGYELRERIAAGGFGAVYRAQQSTIGREVAVKVILPGLANKPDFIRRFEAEAQTIARLEHYFIVPLYDYWRDPDGAYLVMRYLRGGSLFDHIRNQGALSIEDAFMLFSQVAQGLHVAHRNQIIHRDIKPGNVLLDEDGNGFLADFGIAKDHTVSQSITEPDSLIGSPEYLAPEQARSEPVTPQTDIYSLGVVLYEMLAGEHPFPGTEKIGMIFKHLNEPLPDITTLDDRICMDVNNVIQKATAKDPKQRYSDAIEMMEALRQAAQLDTIATPTSPVELLTPREQEVMQLIIDGKTNREIAEQLVLTEGTIRTYITRIYRKLNVRSRVQAIARARDLNFVIQKPESVVSLSTGHLPEPDNPYKGLRAFQAADAQEFFGREKLTKKLVSRLEESGEYKRFLSIVGPSGSGKSSVVKAGLIPALWRGDLPGSENWYIVDLLPGSHPIDELEVTLLQVATDKSVNLREQLQRDARGLVRVADLILPDDGSELLIVIDQFEEVFTLVDSKEERLHFLNLIMEAITDKRSRVRVVVTLRADYYDRPLQYPDFGELVRNRVETVLPLGADELERAITVPANRAGVFFEDGLVSQIVSDVHYQPGALPLLQYALTELFERRDGRKLTLEAYQQIGGTGGALANRADEIYQEQNDDGQELVHQLFLRLVTLGEGAEDTRRRVERAELLNVATDRDMMDEIIDLFASSRLFSLDNDPATRKATVEVAHEAILREWDRLRGWLNESRDDIRQEQAVARAAGEWDEHGQDPSFLLRGTRLEQVEEWRSTSTLVQTPLEQDFIAQSLKQRDKEQRAEIERQEREAQLERRSRNFLRGLVAVFAIAALVAGVLSVFALDQRKAALDNAAETQNVALVAGSQAALAKNDTDTALALAWQAVELNPDSALAQAQLSEAAYSPGTVRVFAEHTERVRDVAISPDEQTMISASWDHTLILWDIQTGESVRQFEAHTDDVEAVAFSPDGQTMVSGSWDTSAILWDVQTGRVIRRFDDYDKPIWVVAFSPNGQSIVATGGEDDASEIIQWDVESGQVIRVYEGHNHRVEALAFTPDGSAILSGDLDGALILWDSDTGEIIHHMGTSSDDRMGSVLVVAIHPDGRHALSGDTNGDLVLWDISIGKEIRRFDTGEWVFSLAYMPDSQYAVFSQGNSNKIILIDLETGRQLLHLTGHSQNSKTLIPISDNRHIISGSNDSTLRLWDIYSGQTIRQFHTPGLESWEIDHSPDGRTALLASYDGSGRLVDIETGTEIGRFEEDQPVVSADLSPDGKMALLGTGFDVTEDALAHVSLWDIETRQKIMQLEGQADVVWEVTFSPDGKTAIFGGNGGTVFQWDLETGEEIRRFERTEGGLPSTASVWGLSFNPDGQTIIAAYVDGPMILWNVESGQEIRRFIGHTGGPEGVVFSHDGQTVLSSGYDTMAILWDTQTGNILHLLEDHTGAVFQSQFSPDGQFVLTGSADGRTLLWDVETGEVIRRYANMGGYFPAFTPDGHSALVAAFGGETPELWRIDATLDELLTWTEENRYIPELTCAQRELYRVEPRCKSEQ